MLYTGQCLGAPTNSAHQPTPNKRNNMQTQLNEFVMTSLLAAGTAAFAIGCASMKSSSAPKEVDVTVAELSVPARATVEKETAGGHVDKITSEVERGKKVYD